MALASKQVDVAPIWGVLVKHYLHQYAADGASASIAAKWLVPGIGNFIQLRPDIDVHLDIVSHLRGFVDGDRLAGRLLKHLSRARQFH